MYQVSLFAGKIDHKILFHRYFSGFAVHSEFIGGMSIRFWVWKV